MLDQQLIKAAEDRIIECYLICQRELNVSLNLPDVYFELRGRRGGYARYFENLIQLNGELFERNQNDFLKRTVGHEAAHLIAWQYFVKTCGLPKIKPHGSQWAQIMRLIGQEPIRCHSYDVSETRQKSRDKWEYKCPCGKEFLFGQAKHIRAKSGIKYFCLKCRGDCIFTGRVFTNS